MFWFFTYNSSTLVGSTFGGTWEDPGSGFIKFTVKRALKQDQIIHMEGKLQVICYFSRECLMLSFVDWWPGRSSKTKHLKLKTKLIYIIKFWGKNLSQLMLLTVMLEITTTRNGGIPPKMTRPIRVILLAISLLQKSSIHAVRYV